MRILLLGAMAIGCSGSDGKALFVGDDAGTGGQGSTGGVTGYWTGGAPAVDAAPDGSPLQRPSCSDGGIQRETADCCPGQIVDIGRCLWPCGSDAECGPDELCAARYMSVNTCQMAPQMCPPGLPQGAVVGQRQAIKVCLPKCNQYRHCARDTCVALCDSVDPEIGCPDLGFAAMVPVTGDLTCTTLRSVCGATIERDFIEGPIPCD